MIKDYLQALREKLADGDATEHTHRSTLEALIKSFGKELHVTNEPKKIKVGSPDLIIRRKIAKGELLPVGYIETKDIGIDLDKIEKTEQLERYKQLPNLILTDYLEFRWYVNGEMRLKETLGSRQGKKITFAKDGERNVEDLIKAFLSQDVIAINNPKELAGRLAGLCRNIDRIISETFAAGEASELMKDLKGAFQRTLLPEITDAQFADMFSQTLGYGLFAARIHHHEMQAAPIPKDSGQIRGSASAEETPLSSPRTRGEYEKQPPSNFPHGTGEGKDSGGGFTRTGAAREIPKSNPFLRDLFYTIHSPDLEDEPFIGLLDDLTAVLAHTDIEQVLAQFGKRTGQEDPILHFYETFLAAYDPAERKRRGVYYTPEPVVSYIVRSVDILLKEKFGLSGGLADESTVEVEVKEGDKFVKRTLPKVLILDPACGTGTFLYAVVDLIRKRFMEQKRAGEWRSFVREHLVPRIYGFELQMAPYAVAHLKLAMQLAGQDLPEAQRKKWGYEFKKDERLNVYLTNSLEYTEEKIQMEFGFIERAIAEEARAAQTIKGDLPIMVVMGNPPYANFGKMNKGEWILSLENDYKKNVNIKKWNSDDYIKFIRFCQWRIDREGQGIVGLITNSGYIDDMTRSGMRKSIMSSFNNIAIYNLHGSTLKDDSSKFDVKDVNVFDIKQGVSIAFFTKTMNREPQKVLYADLFGSRELKYKTLFKDSINNTEWIELKPVPERYFFIPKDLSCDKEWGNDWSVRDIFPISGPGVKTERDKVTIQMDKTSLENVVRSFRVLSVQEIRQLYELGEDSRDWSIERAREDLLSNRSSHLFRYIQYRPYDIRHIWYSGKSKGFIGTPGSRIGFHLLHDRNIGLITVKQQSQPNSWNLVGITNTIAECCAISNKTREINFVFPLYLYPEDGSGRKANLDGAFLAEMEGKLGMKYVEEKAESGKLKAEKRPPSNFPHPLSVSPIERGKGAPPGPPVNGGGTDSGGVRTPRSADEFGPEDVFYYIYAVFHCPTYRERYKEFLKIDFPRVPLTGNRELFFKLGALGRELAQYHLLEHSALNSTPIVFPEQGDNKVEKVTYDEAEKRVYINKTQYFEGVEPAVWAFHVGGYQVCQKWLKDRKGRALSYDDIKHYEKTVMALSETIRLMKAIDAAIPGWPME